MATSELVPPWPEYGTTYLVGGLRFVCDVPSCPEMYAAHRGDEDKPIGWVRLRFGRVGYGVPWFDDWRDDGSNVVEGEEAYTEAPVDPNGCWIGEFLCQDDRVKYLTRAAAFIAARLAEG